MYDLIVVGAGPAGLMAAKTAGENGLRVALLERKTHPEKITRSCCMALMGINEFTFGDHVIFNQRDKRLCWWYDFSEKPLRCYCSFKAC